MDGVSGFASWLAGLVWQQSPGQRVRSTSQLAQLPWLVSLQSTIGCHQVATAKDFLTRQGPQLAQGDMFVSFLRSGLLKDLVILYEEVDKRVHMVIDVGTDVCGHSDIVHGGMSAAIMDETYGALMYAMQQYGQMAKLACFTARLEVDYRKPVPAGTVVVCTAEVQSIDGRKHWLMAKLMDKPGGVVYAEGRALFLTVTKTSA